MEEVWKDIVGYEGLYQVSNFGNVKRNKILKLNIDTKGYYYVNLSKNGKVKNCRVHQLVAKAFLDNKNNLIEVNHIDGIKTNNKVSNLEWCDHKHNMEHARYNNLISQDGIMKVVKCMNNKTKKSIIQIKDGIIVSIFESCADATRKTGIHHVGLCANGLRKTSGGYIWKWQ